MYYAVTVGVVAILLLLTWGVTGITPVALLPVGVVVLIGLVYGLSEFDANRRGIDPVAADRLPEDATATDGADRTESE